MKAISFLLVVTLLTLGACQNDIGSAQLVPNCSLGNTTHPRAVNYQKIIDKFMAAGAVGVSVTVRTPEGTWSAAAGKADIPNQISLTPCHTLRIGSISKAFTAVTVMKLQEEGKLNINDLASKYLPQEYTKNIKNLDKATIKNLLQHTSGIRDYLEIEGVLNIYNESAQKQSAAENLKTIFDKKALFEVGTNWSYSNSNYLLLALIIENVTQKNAYDVVTEKVIRPLNLQNTYASTTLPASLSRGYYDSFNNGMMRDMTQFDTFAVGGQSMLDGGMISNSYDLALFVEALKTGKILSAASVALMESKTNIVIKDIPENLSYIKDYGLGLFLLDLDGKKGIGHGGNVYCFNGITYYFPEQKISIAILLNSYSKKLDEALYDRETLKLAL